MSKRLTNREKLLSKLNNFSENEIGELLKCAMTLERVRHGDGVIEAIPQTYEDELLIMLSAARENCRARQVFEWESVRRRVEGKGSAHWRR
jgi:DNA replication protein DnaC